mmetsp:Transcript_20799/g.59327  ORF Transcript_20799/g.59327 Transcript_20799/m.59327 type:complete len:207 (-) Transcript_20799:1057-1677(-)
MHHQRTAGRRLQAQCRHKDVPAGGCRRHDVLLRGRVFHAGWWQRAAQELAEYHAHDHTQCVRLRNRVLVGRFRICIWWRQSNCRWHCVGHGPWHQELLQRGQQPGVLVLRVRLVVDGSDRRVGDVGGALPNDRLHLLRRADLRLRVPCRCAQHLVTQWLSQPHPRKSVAERRSARLCRWRRGAHDWRHHRIVRECHTWSSARTLLR